MTQLDLPPEKRRVAIKLFEQGKQDDFDLDDVLEQFRQECHRRTNLIQMFIEIQIATSFADGKIHKAEREILYHIGERLGFGSHVMQQLIDMVAAQQHFSSYESAGARGRGDYRSAAATSAPSLDDAYAVLGISPDVDDAEVKKAYRRQMNQHHPDKLVSKGLPEEMIKLATEKTKDIKMAYEKIKKTRALH